jgi:hypothetical protein
MPSAQASRTFRYKSTVKILPPSLSPERVKVVDFYAARSRIIPPLPWPTFSPPFSRKRVFRAIWLSFDRETQDRFLRSSLVRDLTNNMIGVNNR